MSKPDLNDCFRHDGKRLSHDAAVRLLKERITVTVGSCDVPAAAALGRILASPITAVRNVPPHTNAAVDGFAVSSRAYQTDRGAKLPVTGRSAAGVPFDGKIDYQSAVRILTGAVVPAGLDMVAMQEDCVVSSEGGVDYVAFPPGLRGGDNIRPAGEDVKAGGHMFDAGHILRPQDLAALSSIGLGSVMCFKKLRVSIVSTGDEIVRAGSVPVAGEGLVFDTNQPMLGALSELAGGDMHDAGIWRDDRGEVTDRLGELAGISDVILTSGGASMGDEDHMSAALDALGTRHFWQLSIKPGRPLMLGQIGPTVVVGLPGNPVAVFVCFLVYVWPMLRALAGAGWREPRRMPARALFAFTGRKRGRREFWRGTLAIGDDGLAVDKFQRDGSGLISGLRVADCLIEIPEDVGDIAVGDMVRVMPFSEFGILSG